MPDAPSLAAWVKDQPATRPAVAYEMDDLAALMATGGTTGMPKGVMNTHRSLQTFVANYMIAIRYRADEQPVNLAAAPMTHTAGVLSMPCTARGGTVVILAKPDPAALLDAIAKHRVTEFFLPPTVIYRLLDIPGIEQVRFLVAAVLHVRRGADVGREAQAGDHGVRSGDDRRLRPDRSAGVDFVPAPEEHFVDGKLAAGRAPVLGRTTQSAGPRRPSSTTAMRWWRRARPARSACAAIS